MRDHLCSECGTAFRGHPRSRYCAADCRARAAARRRRAYPPDTRVCAFPGCDRAYYGKGHCQSHYDQIRFGRTYKALEPRTKGPVADRLAFYTDKTDSCWVWTGTRNDVGYGQLTVDGRMQYVHRLSYEALVGPIPDGMQIDHLCRNTLCLRPEHLEPVTPAENVRRMRMHNVLPERSSVGRWIPAAPGDTFTEGDDTMPTNQPIRTEGDER